MPDESPGAGKSNVRAGSFTRAASFVLYLLASLLAAALLEAIIRLDFWPDIAAAPRAVFDTAMRLLPLGTALAVSAGVVHLVLLPLMRFLSAGVGPNGALLGGLRAWLRARFQRDRSEVDYKRAESTLLGLIFAAALLAVLLFGGYLLAYFDVHLGVFPAVLAALFIGWCAGVLAPRKSGLQSLLVSAGWTGLLLVIIAHLVRLP